MEAETALTLPDKAGEMMARIKPSLGFTPQTFEDAWRFAKIIANSGLAPKDYQGKPDNVLVAMQMGAEVGLSPMAAIQNIAVINGRPSLWGDAALGVVQVHPAYEWHKETFTGTGDLKIAIFEIKRKANEVHTSSFSVADAKKAGLWGKTGPWTTYSDRMLMMRARGFGLRDKFADALRGLSIAEESMDMPTIEIDQDLNLLPETIQRRSEIEPLPVDVMNEAKAAQEKLDAARLQEDEPSVKRTEAHDLQQVADVKGIEIKF